MVKTKNNDLMATLAAIFCFIIAFLKTVPLLSAFQLTGLLMPCLWVLLGLCLLTKKKNWMSLIAMLPLVILSLGSVSWILSFSDLGAMLRSILCSMLPALSMALLWILFMLCCVGKSGGRRKLWFIPILMMLPWCILEYGNTAAWAQLGVVAFLSIWLKPAGK